VVRFLCALLILCSCAACTPGPATLSFSADRVGAPNSGAPAELFMPTGTGPFPAMVVLHACGGVQQRDRDWAKQLSTRGYVALVVDSFRPRGAFNVCWDTRAVPPLWRAQGAFGAADYLRTLPYVRADRIGVIGFSHGGSSVMRAVLADTVQHDHATPFAAAVAFYPGCDPPGSPLASDTLILIGDADDWTPVERCILWRDQVQRAGHVLQMKIYPGALHAFDAGAMPQVYAGHRVGGDRQAAADATTTARNFLAQRLSP